MGARVRIRRVDMVSCQGMVRLETEGGGWCACKIMKQAVCHFKLVSFRGQIKLKPPPDWSPLRI